MGLGPGGQPIDANHLNKGMGMGNMGPGGKKTTHFMEGLSSFSLSRQYYIVLFRNPLLCPSIKGLYLCSGLIV